jgi:DNA-binding transcriptional ArsR family regulator
MNTTFEALVDPNRRRILDMLREHPRLVGELVAALKMSQPLVSKHLKVLRDAGLVTVRQDAQRRWYELKTEPLAEVDAWLEPFRHAMEARYERLDDLLEKLQQEEKHNEQDESDR